MSVLPGREDMKPRKVLGFTAEGQALIAAPNGTDVIKYDMFIGPSGTAHFKAAVEPEPTGVDQDIKDKPPASKPVAERWRGIDQQGALQS